MTPFDKSEPSKEGESPSSAHGVLDPQAASVAASAESRSRKDTGTTTWIRAGALLFTLGFFIGPVLDGLHTFSGTLWYPVPQFLRSVWWVPPLFASAALSIGLGRPMLDRLGDIGSDARGASPGRTLAAFAVFIGSYAASGFLPLGTAAMCLLLGGTALFSWTAFDRTVRGAIHVAVVSLGGTFVEITLVSRELFSYRAGDLFGVPSWLPLLYVSAAVAVGALGKRLTAGR